MLAKLVGKLVSFISFLSSTGASQCCFKVFLDEEVMPDSLINK